MESRLDLFLVTSNMLPSRSKASELIEKGKILVNDKVILKPAFKVNENDKITILEDNLLTYVSRGGLKLEKAINSFNIDVNNFVCVDIGSSTGGFTDCLLKHNAKKVFAIDVGTNQLVDSLRNDNRVVVYENTNFKDVTTSFFNESIDLYVCDVSFISIMTILKKLKELDDHFRIIILFKPQFEVGKNNLNNNGVVKNSKIVIEYLKRFVNDMRLLDIGINNFSFSPICGHHEGNIEYLFELINHGTNKSFDIEKIVDDSYKILKVK